MKLRIDLTDVHLLALPWYLDNGYVVCRDPEDNAKQFRLHRLITKAAVGQVVDHANGDTLDNRRRNLRVCSHAENMRNRKVHKNNSSGFPNVLWEPPRGNRRGAFAVQVRVNGTKHRKGGFASAEDAYQIAKEMLSELHGEFNKLLRVEPRRPAP